MTRGEALALLKSHVGADKLERQCLAAETAMREPARRVHRDEGLRGGIAGLPHGTGLEQPPDKPAIYGRPTEQILIPYALPQEIIDALVPHSAEFLDLERESILDCAPTCVLVAIGPNGAVATVPPAGR